MTDDSEAVRTAIGATEWQRGFRTLHAKEVMSLHVDLEAMRMAIGATEWQKGRLDDGTTGRRDDGTTPATTAGKRVVLSKDVMVKVKPTKTIVQHTQWPR